MNAAAPKRQSSAKAPAQRRRLIPQDIYGVSDSGDIRLTVNASKNLFGDESYNANKLLLE